MVPMNTRRRIDQRPTVRSIARVAKETGLTRQTVYRIKNDPASAEAGLAAWGL
jgi:DNA invertase Pin-like site-specific DNA recombinase